MLKIRLYLLGLRLIQTIIFINIILIINIIETNAATVEVKGDIHIKFYYFGNSTDMLVDCVKTNLPDPRQTENMEFKTAAWANNQFGGGSFTQWIHCNGAIEFRTLPDNYKTAASMSKMRINLFSISIYPKSGSGSISTDSEDSNMNTTATIFAYTGKVIYKKEDINDELIQFSKLESRIYIININTINANITKKLVVY